MKASNVVRNRPWRVSYPLSPVYFSRPNSTAVPVALTEQRGRKLTPWLRAMKEIRARGDRPPDLPRAELTPKRMSESHSSVKLPFSTDEVGMTRLG